MRTRIGVGGDVVVVVVVGVVVVGVIVVRVSHDGHNVKDAQTPRKE